MPITLVSDAALNIFARTNTRACVVSSLTDAVNALATLETPSDHETRMLDLTGHTRRGTRLLAIGRDTLDLFVPGVEHVMKQIAESGVLRRLRIQALRLIGCETAVTPAGQHTMRRLARLLEMPVYGTRKRIASSHYANGALDPCFDHLLIESAQLPPIAQRLPLLR